MLGRFDHIRRINFFTAACLLLACALAATAQEGTATLRGTVLDANGAAVPGAQVSIANQETGLNRRTATTGEDGEYVFTSLTPGLYRIMVEAAGFKRSLKENVKLDVGEEQEFKVGLEVGGADETVTVSADEPLIQTTSKEIGGAIGPPEPTHPPFGQPQLHRLRRAAARRRAQHQHLVVRLRLRQRQRARPALQQLHARRVEQQ